jgi:ABC-type uncharacterized transport system involved in gliding motility auxiliary subunit
MLKRTIGILGWLGVALVVSAVLVRFAQPDRQEVWRGLAYAGLATVLLYMATQWREIAGTFSRRNTQLGTVSATSIVVFLGILVGINYVAGRQNKRWDLTTNKQFSLSDQTTKVLRALDEPLTIKVFDRSDNFPRFRDRLSEYEYASSQVQVEYVDIDREPARATQLDVQQYGTLVLQHKGRTERVTTDSEQEITNAIIKAVQGAEKKVYFVQGHGEKDPTASDQRTGYSGASDALKRDNFAVETLVLAQQTDVPDDASVVVIAGPKADYFEPEIEALKRYLDKGGKLLLQLDPPTASDATDTPNLVALAKEWGAEVGTNVVLDISGMGQLLGTGPSVPVAATYPSHAMTDNFGLVTAFPLARSVAPVTGGDSTRVAQRVVETGPRSWAETDLGALAAGTEVAYDADKGDTQGPVSIATAISVAAPNQPDAPAAEGESAPEGGDGAAPPRKETRVVVFGDSDFASNGGLGIQGNRDLFVNAVNWLAQQENLIAIRPRDPEDRRVNMTADQQFRTLLISLLVVPGLALAAGVASWWRRRSA